MTSLACYIRTLPAFLIALTITLSFISQSRADELKILRFATYATERPSEELRKMEPFQKDVELGLRRRGVVARIDMRIFPTYSEANTALVAGEVDFVRFGPASYVVAKQRNPDLILLAMEGHEGKKHFSGVIIVREDSPIRTLADLRGKKIAFGDPTSTTGRYLSQGELIKAGVLAKDLAAYDYLGRHDKVVFAVASGAYDAGATNEGTFDKYAREKGLRELVRFPCPTQAWIARSGLDAKTVNALRETLLAMKGPGLGYIDRNGFQAASDSDYDVLRKAFKVAPSFTD